MQDEGSTSRDGDSSLDHDLVDDFRVSLHLEVTSLGNTNETRKESLARDSHVIKFEVSVVDAVVAQLGANVTDLDAG